MMQAGELMWSETEQQIAKVAFEKAYERETQTLVQMIRDSADQIAELKDLWKLHDFLSARRHDIDGKYDYDYSELIFTFAQLVKQGWLNLEDLEGLDKTKITKVAALTRM
ncbi:MAG: hypothetical protein HC835_02240 [Oscillatoriales cyanobacterium RM2_1_1]|nr:hypothetical protein [Oscillatoriales cyanobacterium SM2_3_0]NJO44538.1 hypothetical protein [Oscillatoriales cyanobacterium RM2_1_1]